jgi:demethylmenaquinone methyltransferase/2-methoxy-6-polyprenyl-1,4-benzoquinol methylase
MTPRARALGNRERYNRMARAYEALVRFGSLGQFERFYRTVAAELDARPGGTLLDLGCGLGTLVPHLLPKVAPGGTVIGVDVAERLLERARQRAEREAWPGVTLVHADVRDFAPPRPVDGIAFCLSLTALSGPVACLERALSWLVPGGQLVVLDSLPEAERPLARRVIRAKARFVGAEPSEGPLRYLVDHLEAARIRRFQLGVYTLVSGRKRGGRSEA